VKSHPINDRGRSIVAPRASRIDEFVDATQSLARQLET
jgi:hypothetical protein